MRLWANSKAGTAHGRDRISAYIFASPFSDTASPSNGWALWPLNPRCIFSQNTAAILWPLDAFCVAIRFAALLIAGIKCLTLLTFNGAEPFFLEISEI